MKIFTKLCLGIAVFFAGVAAVCTLVVMSMGFTTQDFIKMVEDGKLSIQIENGKIEIFGLEEKEIFELDWDFFEDEDESELELEDGKAHDITGEYVNLEVEFGAGQLEIYYDDVENIQFKKEDLVGFEIKKNEISKTIHIEGGLKANSNDNAKLIIIVPKNHSFENVELNVGAGQAIVKNLHANSLEVEVGAGQVTVEIEGSENTYSYDVSCGIGNVVIGDVSFGGFGANSSVQQEDSDKKIEVKCGVGEVIIRFVKDDII